MKFARGRYLWGNYYLTLSVKKLSYVVVNICVRCICMIRRTVQCKQVHINHAWCLVWLSAVNWLSSRMKWFVVDSKKMRFKIFHLIFITDMPVLVCTTTCCSRTARNTPIGRHQWRSFYVRHRNIRILKLMTTVDQAEECVYQSTLTTLHFTPQYTAFCK